MVREPRSPDVKSRSGGPINGQGIKAKAPLGSSAFADAVRSSEHWMAGGARARPVRRAAHPLRAITR